MSGPPYPSSPVSGSNGIGQFVIGVSAIGSIPAFDWWRTVISQYANSPILTRLLENFFECLDPTANFDAFFDNVWNIDTATGHGLDVWGRILGVGRTLLVPAGDFWGFAESTTAGTFADSTFYSGSALTSNYDLSDDPYRTLLLAKAASNITDGSIKSINTLLRGLFPNRGNAYVIEGGLFDGKFFGFEEATTGSPFGSAPFYSGLALPQMTITYVFEFVLSTVERAIVQQSGVLPKPAGVNALAVQTL